jgi:hypothetical protein
MTVYNRPFRPVTVFTLAAPVNSGSEFDAEVGGAIAEVGVVKDTVIFETTGVAVGPTKVAGKVTPKEIAHAFGSRPRGQHQPSTRQ